MADLISSSKSNPCPICSREKDGDCRISAEVVLCHHGSNHHPPEHLKRGEVITGADGQQWAFTGDTSDGRAATFTIHKPLEVPSPDALTRGAEGVWRYSSTFYVCRFRGKKIRPLSWIDGGWRWRGPGSNRPMLLSHPLATRPNTTVLIVEGEQTWDAARRLFPGLVVCCWSGGCRAISKTNFTALAGRKVVLWPDNDDAGRDAMQEIAQVLHGIGATSVKVVANPADAPQGWDLADADWTPADATAWVKANTSTVEKAPAAAAEAPAANPPTTGAKPAPVSFEQRWALLEQNAEELSSKNWPLMKVMAALAVITSELELRLSSRQLEQLLEDAQRRLRGTAAPLQGGGVITVQSTPWAVEGLFRHSLNLLVGQSGAGKSRLMAACFAAWLQGHSAWLGLPMHSDLPVDQRHVLIVGSDQLMEDWLLTLEPVGLMERMGTAKARLHSRLTLHSLETGTQLDADGLAVIRRWCDDHPGCAVLVDSLAAALPPGIDEDRPAAAKPIHALQEALGTCWGVLTHHSRKGAGKEGNLGVGAGRGSSAIDAAVSRVIGLGLIHKVENGQLVAQESDPRRELLSTKRGGATLHIVVRSDGAGRWTNEGTAEELKRQERQERTLANLTDNQAAVMDALQESSDWLTSRQVVENLLADGEEYDNRGSKAASTRKTLKRLAALGLIGSQRQGSEWVYRVAGAEENQESHPHADEVKRGGSTCSTTAAQGISPALPEVRDGSTGSPAAAQPGEPGRASRATGEPAGEQARTVALQGESKESQSAPRAALSTGSPPPAELMEQLIALRQQHPTAAPAALAIHMDPTGTGKPSGRQVKAWISWLDRQEAAA